MTIEVRVACEANSPDIAKLECALGRVEWDRDGVDGILGAPSNSGLVALKDGLQVGHVIYGNVMDEVEILTVAVDPGFRRQGIGLALMRRIVRETQARTMVLEVRASNGPAIALYQKMGFANVGRRKGYYRGGEDAIVMRVSLVDGDVGT